MLDQINGTAGLPTLEGVESLSWQTALVEVGGTASVAVLLEEA